MLVLIPTSIKLCNNYLHDVFYSDFHVLPNDEHHTLVRIHLSRKDLRSLLHSTIFQFTKITRVGEKRTGMCSASKNFLKLLIAMHSTQFFLAQCYKLIDNTVVMNFHIVSYGISLIPPRKFHGAYFTHVIICDISFSFQGHLKWITLVHDEVSVLISVQILSELAAEMC